MRDSPSVHSQHSLNARLLRFRSQPHSEDAYALVEDLIDAGRHADARSVIGLAKPSDREDAALLLLEGRAHLMERDLIRAQAALLQAIKLESSLQAAYRYLGEVLLKRGDPLRARKTLRRALALGSDDAEARELLERAEYLVEAANDSLEALPSARDSEFDVDAQAELQAAEFVDQLPSEPAGDYREAPELVAAPGAKRVDEPTSQFRFGRRRAPDAVAEPASSHRQKTQADRVSSPPLPPRQRARRQDNADDGLARRPAGAFQPAPPPPALGLGDVDQTAFDSEPAAAHVAARQGTELERPSARRDAQALPEAAPASPRGAWTTQDASASDFEPALSHSAARAGAEPEPRVRAPRPAPRTAAAPSEQADPPFAASGADVGTGRSAQRAAPPAPPRRAAPVGEAPEAGDDVPASWGAGAPSVTRDGAGAFGRGAARAPAAAARQRTAAQGDQPTGDDTASGSRDGAGAFGRSAARAPAAAARQRTAARVDQPTDNDAVGASRDMGLGTLHDDEPGVDDVPDSWGVGAPSVTRGAVRPHGAPPAPPRRAAAPPAEPFDEAERVARARSSAPAGSPALPPRAAESLDEPFDEAERAALARSSAPAGARDSVPGSPRRAASREPVARGRSSAPAGAADSARADAPERRSARPGRGAFGKRLSDFRIHPGADPAPAAQAPVAFASDSGEEGRPDAEQVLAVVRQLGLFEEPSGQADTWATRRDVEPRGQRVRGALFWLWGVSLMLCAAGYFAWNQFVERRHAAAASFVAQARVLMSQGDHAALVDAERLLRLAREQHPASTTVTEEALSVQLQRVLEDGERDTATLRSAFARAQAAHVTGPGMALANLLLSAAVSDMAGRDRALSEVFAMAKGDARTLYLVGRAEERMGLDAAQTHFEAAASADAKLIPAQLALAERAYERGERAAALRTLDGALANAPNQLRVRLFRMLVAADDAEPDTLRQDLNGLAAPLRKGNSIDRALAALVRARLARRGGEHMGALKAIEAAAASGAEDARVLGWLAEEALAIGNTLLAQQLASRALQVLPERVRSRRLLARILIERGAGQQAFVLLSSLPAADIEVQVWKARAALLSNDPELLRNALAVLPTSWTKKSDVDVQRAALRLRIETQLDPSKAVLDRAQKLVHAAPTDPDALLALAEAALAQRDAKLAQHALKQRALLLPDDVQAQTLLGRSLRMAGDAQGADAAFRKALSLHPGYVDAQASLASLLLDRGQFDQADALYRELAVRDETALSGRLGRVEALLGQAKLGDAQVQLEAAPEAERATAAYREVSAKLALARGEVGQALKLLGPLSEELPKRAPLRAMHAEALITAAQLSAAEAELDAALALDPGLPEALLGRAELQLRANKTKDALSTLGKAEAALRERLRPPGQDARRLVLLGRTLVQRKKRGDTDAALRALRQAAGQASPPAEAFFFLGEALSINKDKAGAQEAYRRYLDLAPSGAYRQRAQRMLGTAR